MNIDQVIVVGAGASGLTAAVMAARAGASVRVLEMQKKPGRKLLATGNGRCNLTNMDPELVNVYHSVGSAPLEEMFAGRIISVDGAARTRAFFESIGVLTQERGGYVYPASGQAQSVLSALLTELERLHVRMKYDTRVNALTFDSEAKLWMVHTDGWVYPAKTVVLAGGSIAGMPGMQAGSAGSPDGKKLPGDGSPAAAPAAAYHLAEMAGHTLAAPLRPALTAIHCLDPDLKLCDGARTRAKVTLFGGGMIPSLERTAGGGFLLPAETGGQSIAGESERIIARDEGEVQWTASELSGIPVFQLSRFAAELSDGNPMVIAVDFLPELEEETAARQLERLIRTYAPRLTPVRLLSGFVHERVAAYLARKAGIAGFAGAAAGEAAVLAAMLKRLALKADGVRGFGQAQICTGGIALSEVNPETLESLIRPGLFLAGEMLDIDGPCGGYNLQWAWSSGMAAGRAAAERAAAGNTCI